MAADFGWLGPSRESCGMGLERPVQRRGAGVVDPAVGAVVDRGWRVPADSRMVMDVVVLGEEPVAECPGLCQQVEVVREVVDILQRLELRLGERNPTGFLVGVNRLAPS